MLPAGLKDTPTLQTKIAFEAHGNAREPPIPDLFVFNERTIVFESQVFPMHFAGKNHWALPCKCRRDAGAFSDGFAGRPRQ